MSQSLSACQWMAAMILVHRNGNERASAATPRCVMGRRSPEKWAVSSRSPAGETSRIVIARVSLGHVSVRWSRFSSERKGET